MLCCFTLLQFETRQLLSAVSFRQTPKYQTETIFEKKRKKIFGLLKIVSFRETPKCQIQTILEHICGNIAIFKYQQTRYTNLKIPIIKELDPFHKNTKSVKSLLASNEKRGKRNSVVVQSTGPSLVKSNRAGGCSSICTNDCQTTSAFVTQFQFGSVLPIYSLS